MPRNICFIYLLIPLLSIGMWLHFMMASTASATLENSIRPDDDRSVFSGNIRTAVGGTSLSLKSCSNCSSPKPGGVLKKWRIYFRIFESKIAINIWKQGYIDKSIYLARRLNAIFACLCRGQESIVFRASVFFEAGTVIWKAEWIRHLGQEVLFGETACKRSEIV